VPTAARRALQVAAILLLALLIGLFAKSLVDNGTTVAAQVGDGKQPSAPNFKLPRLNGGGDLSLASLRGKVVVLNFWGSWCGPCKEEAPVLQELADRYKPDGVTILGVDEHDLTSDGRAFVSRYHLTYPIVHDGSGDVENKWGLTALPETFVISRTGDVVAHFAYEIQGPELDRALRPLLAENPA
jgi:cytochrome c biogenesis protein CcmG, thiol:disulfide interchange protein DsbE